MIPPYTYAAGRLAEERMADVMRDGEHARLMHMARPAKLGWRDRLLAALGDRLAALGETLEARHAPPRTDLRDSVLRGSR